MDRRTRRTSFHGAFAGSSLVSLLILAGCAQEAAQQAGAEQEPAWQEIEVVGTDYAFALTETPAAGPTLFRLNNIGAVEHELILGSLTPGATLAQVMELMEAGEDPEPLIDEAGGVLFADAGALSDAQLLMNLVSGRTYVLLCFFQDEDDAPPHVALGMATSFDVE